MDYQPEDLDIEQKYRELEQIETNSPEYGIVTGSIYDQLRHEEPGVTPSEALEVSQLLTAGNIEQAEQKTKQILEK